MRLLVIHAALFVMFNSCFFPCYSEQELGDIDTAKQSTPDIFKPGLVSLINIKGTPCYAACGVSERLFGQNENVETDTELYNECEISAKKYLLRALAASKDGTFVLSLKSFKRMYFWREGSAYFANFYVPEADASIKAIEPVKQAAAPPINEKEQLLIVSNALKYYSEGNYKEASNIFNSMDTSKCGSLIENTAKKSNLLQMLNEKGYETLCLPKLGLIYFKEQNYTQAKIYFEKYLQSNPDKNNKTRSVLDMISKCCDNLNMKSDAVKYYSRIAAEYPDDTDDTKNKDQNKK